MENHSHDNHGAFKLNTIIWGSLYALTIISVWVTHFDLTTFSVFVALGVASVKAYLVAAYFMHLKFESKILSIMVIVTVLVFITFIILTLIDYSNR